MTLLEIKREIGKKLGDPDLDKYRGLVKDAFCDAIVSLLHSEDYTEQEIFSLVERTSTSDIASGDTLPSSSIDAIKILNVVASTNESAQLIRKTPEEIDRIKTDSELDTLANEKFYYLVGSKIYFYPYSTSMQIVTNYVKDPDFDGWGDTTIVDGKYKLTFIKRAIGLAVSSLGGYKTKEPEARKK
jgi:hypothetical protein